MIPKFTPLALAAVLSLPFAKAEEYSIKLTDHESKIDLKGVYLPTQGTSVSLSPEKWKDYTVAEITAQGSLVKKGDVIVAFDTKSLDEKLQDAQAGVKMSQLSLELKELEYHKFIATQKMKLDAAKRKAKEATENLDRFLKIDLPHAKASSKQSVKSAEQSLSYTMEELKQLTKMYKDDEATEETEEIILIRQRNSVESSKFRLVGTKLRSEKTLKVDLPRRQIGLENAVKSAELDLGKVEKSQSKERANQEITLKQTRVHHERKVADLTALQADRKLMELKAPQSGVLYYGGEIDGAWSLGDAQKSHRVKGRMALNREVFTVVDKGSPLKVVCRVEDAQRFRLKAGQAALITSPDGRAVPATLKNLSATPLLDRKYLVSFAATALPVRPTLGSAASLSVTSADLKDAIVVGKKYLNTAADGSYTVQVKLADGKTEDRQVEVLLFDGDKAVIAKGLSADQVIVE